MKLVHLPCSLKVYERHSGAPSTFLFVALKDLPKNFKGPACVAVTLVVNHTLQTHQLLGVKFADSRKCSFDDVTDIQDDIHTWVICTYMGRQTSMACHVMYQLTEYDICANALVGHNTRYHYVV